MKIIIYSSLLCPYCRAAKVLLNTLKLRYEEILIDNKPEVKKQMINKSSGKETVPQVFIGGNHIGGYDDLKEVYDNKKLFLIFCCRQCHLKHQF